MGGKRLKFPARKKFVVDKSVTAVNEEQPVSEEEKKRRLEMLKSLGLIKE